MNNKDIAIIAAKLLDERKAENILVLDVGLHSSFADYLVIASGGSERQVGTLAEDVADRLAKEGVIAKNVEGKKTSGWILIDFGDVIVNVFSREQRDRYNIEKVWADCPRVDVEFIED